MTGIKTRMIPTISALLAAAFYAISTPFSKLLLNDIQPTALAAFLYLGAGVGVGFIYLFHIKEESKTERLTKEDLPYTLGMILLDIAAPIFLMMGINLGYAANASLLGNFEIVATSLIALLIFKEKISLRLWMAIGLIMISSMILSLEESGSFQFSVGSLLVLLAACCWGFENNCTRKISSKSTYQIVVLKGIFSGGGALGISLLIGERLPEVKFIAIAMLLGFVAYGLSIFLYIRAQRELGAAKTSAYYAIAPFVGAFLAFLVIGEGLTESFFIGLVFMMGGSLLTILDTFAGSHEIS